MEGRGGFDVLSVLEMREEMGLVLVAVEGELILL